VEDHVIKSALEIAREKIAKMQDLTPAEIIERQKKECQPRGEAIANKYMGGLLRNTDLEIELGKYPGKESILMRKAILTSLSQSLDLENKEKNQRAIAGMQILVPELDFEETGAEVESICNEFQQEKERKYAIYEETGREKLQELGISGSAVRTSPGKSQDWQTGLKETQQAYDVRLTSVKEWLSRHIEGQVPE